MYKTGFALMLVLLIACHSKKTTTSEEGFSFNSFSEQFKTVPLPYQLSDTALLRNKDTARISADFASFIPDSITSKIFDEGKIRYYAVAKIKGKQNIWYYIVKAISGNKKAALLVTFIKDQFGSVLPFIVPDEDGSTSQVSTIDNTLSISKTTTKRKSDGTVAEGRNVYEYDAQEKKFLLIMTNPLDNSKIAVINPIDTLPHKHKFSGDYIKDKRNFVSIRDDRRNPNQVLAFIHFEKNNGDCTGELKGELLFTSATTAVYRHGGDPCVLNFSFTPGSVTIKEEEGCGSHRGINCVFDDTYQKKKEAKAKPQHKHK